MRTWQVAQEDAMQLAVCEASPSKRQQVFHYYYFFFYAHHRKQATALHRGEHWRHGRGAMATFALSRPTYRLPNFARYPAAARTQLPHIDGHPSSCCCCPASRMKNVRKCENESAPCCNLLCQHNKYYIQLVCQRLTDPTRPIWGGVLHFCLLLGGTFLGRVAL